MSKIKKQVKIILNNYIHGLGDIGKVCDVKRGYAMYLIHKNLAYFYSESIMNEINKKMNSIDNKYFINEIKDFVNKVKNIKTLTFNRSSNNNNVLYKALNEEEVLGKIMNLYNNSEECYSHETQNQALKSFVKKFKCSVNSGSKTIKTIGKHSISLQSPLFQSFSLNIQIN